MSATLFIDPKHPECYCQECGGVNTLWYVDNDLWLKVMGQREPDKGIVCPNCFIKKAELKGITIFFRPEE